MRITIDELKRMDEELRKVRKEYILNAPSYVDGFILVQSGTDKTDVDLFARKLRGLVKQYKGISFFLIRSTTDSNNSKRVTKKTHKRGRPKTVITGKKVESHLHCTVVNTNENVKISEVKKEVTKYCIKRKKKRPKMKQQKIKDLSGMFITKYMDKQADERYHGGDFDFDYFLDERYAEYENDNDF